MTHHHHHHTSMRRRIFCYDTGVSYLYVKCSLIRHATIKNEWLFGSSAWMWRLIHILASRFFSNKCHTIFARKKKHLASTAPCNAQPFTFNTKSKSARYISLIKHHFDYLLHCWPLVLFVHENNECVSRYLPVILLWWCTYNLGFRHRSFLSYSLLTISSLYAFTNRLIVPSLPSRWHKCSVDLFGFIFWILLPVSYNW